jgi:integrase/recombinase XerD
MDLRLNSSERTLRALLYYGALRVSAVVGLRVCDVSFVRTTTPTGETCHGTIRSVSKRRREHLLPIGEELSNRLAEHLAARPDAQAASPLLVKPNGAPYSRRVVEYRVRAWGEAAGVANCSPHRFRHTCATELLMRGEDIRVIKEYLGHASIHTTMVYTKVHNVDLVRAARRLEQ